MLAWIVRGTSPPGARKAWMPKCRDCMDAMERPLRIGEGEVV